MSPKHDYTVTRACLERALSVLEEARRATGRTNLSPVAAPGAIRAQIDDIDLMVAEAAAELAAAREACAIAARRGLSLCDDARG